jgi:hypothetical protein
MYEHYDFTNNAGSVVEDNRPVYLLNSRGGIRIIPTVKSLSQWLRRRLVAMIVPRWSLY